MPVDINLLCDVTLLLSLLVLRCRQKVMPGHGTTTQPLNCLRTMEVRLATTDCMAMVEAILSHRDTRLMSRTIAAI
jgi:hypothetical protein